MITPAQANEVGRRWRDLEEQLAAIDQEEEILAAVKILQAGQVRKAALREEIVKLRAEWDPLVEKLARRQLAKDGGRTWISPFIQVKLVACPKTVVELVDQKRGMAFVVKHCPEAIVYEPKLVKAKFSTAFLSKVCSMTNAALRRAGISVTKPHDNVHISLVPKL